VKVRSRALVPKVYLEKLLELAKGEEELTAALRAELVHYPEDQP
jgi:hypothetical protein